ncbi:TP53-target gene 5 protein isoform X2 [Equus caballus]|uniref:TP53-target gene 5 protein isoform X2 n=1 Tax=Equus caballus TaxID=9796 RepID=UPI0038B244C7
MILERISDLPKEMKTSGNGQKKMQDKESQDKSQQPVSRVVEQNRLKMLLKNLSLLRLFNSSNPRTRELYNLAKRCWNSLLRVPKILRISSGNNDACNKVEEHNEELQEARSSKETLESKKFESIEEPKEVEPKVGVGETNKAQQSPAAGPQKEEQAEPEVPKTSRDPGAQGRQPPTGGSRVFLLKTLQHRIPKEDTKQLEAADQWVWFEGLPKRVRLPGPRAMCRPSALRWVKRCCTRFCSASLELPMCRSYRV